MGQAIEGIGASTGLATGRVVWWKKIVRDVESAEIPENAVDAQVAGFDEAVNVAKKQIEALREETAKRIGKAEASVFEAHLAFLNDPAYVGEIQNRISQQHQNAAYACETVTNEMHDMLRSLPDEYLSARADDIRDVGDRLLGILTHQESFDPLLIQPGTVVVAEELTPSETAQLNDQVVALVTGRGSKTGHAAIIARSMGIPLVLGIGDSIAQLTDGMTVIIDGDAGVITVNPVENEIAKAREKAADLERRRAEAMASVSQPAITLDKKKIDVFANIGSPKDVSTALENGAEGIGLFRTEFLYQENEHWPTETEQYEAYKQVLQAFGEKPVIIRTLDIGGDKKLPYFDMPKEDNPFLGERAIRFCQAHPEIFRTQLRALLRASSYGTLWILLPMVENVDEVENTKQLIEECKNELKAEGQQIAEKIPVGIMVEIPAAALMADVLAPHVDFFSVGTNDLTQYSLAVDRGNERIAHLYDAAHPAVLRLIRQTCVAANKAGIPVGVCGELAGDTRAVKALIGLGVSELSMSSKRIADVKAKIRKITATEAEDVALEVLKQESAEKVYACLESNLH